MTKPPARRYYPHQVELLPPRPLHPVTPSSLPPHWPRDDAKGRRLVEELRRKETTCQ